MKKLFIILILFTIFNNAFGYNDNPNDDKIWCSYKNNDTEYNGLEELRKQCDSGLDKIIFLKKHGHNNDDINKNFPYFYNFMEKCITFLDSIYKDENGKEILKYGSKDCSSVQAIVHAGDEFDVKVKQENLIIDSEINKIKEKNE